MDRRQEVLARRSGRVEANERVGNIVCRGLPVFIYVMVLKMDRALFISFMTGSAGSTTSLYYIGEGVIAGIDAGGMKYNGVYTINSNGSYQIAMVYFIPKGVLLVTGQKTTEEQRVDFSFELPPRFWMGEIIRIDSPAGVVNARFEKLIEL